MRNGRLGPIDMELIVGVSVLRGVTWVWTAMVVVLSREHLDEPAVAAGLVGAAGVVTAWYAVTARRHPLTTLRPIPLAVELTVAAALLAADTWVYDDARPQALAGAWPLAALIQVAVTWGARPGLAVAALFGAARAFSEGVASVDTEWTTGRGLAVLSSTVLYGLTAVVASTVANRVRSAEDSAALARAREEVARDLHDGMLQTLAVVQRRSDDRELVRLARTQEAELRAYLYGGTRGPNGVDPGSEGAALDGVVRAAVAAATQRHGVKVDVAIVPPVPDLDPTTAAALAGALGELFANVAKHAGTDRAVVYAELVDGTVMVSVRDRGTGFAVDAIEPRGLTRSVRSRIEPLGGSVVVRSQPGQGTEVALTVPATSAARAGR